MTEVEVERRGYHRLAAKGHMTDEELYRGALGAGRGSGDRRARTGNGTSQGRGAQAPGARQRRPDGILRGHGQ